MSGSLAAKPLAPGTLVRPIGSQSKLSIGAAVRAEPIYFDGGVYQLVHYPSLGGLRKGQFALGRLRLSGTAAPELVNAVLAA